MIGLIIMIAAAALALTTSEYENGFLAFCAGLWVFGCVLCFGFNV